MKNNFSPQKNDVLNQLYEKTHTMIGWLDKNNQILGLNHVAVSLLGYRSLDAAIGTTPYDMPCPAVECVEQFIEQDHYVINNNKNLQILDIHPYADGSNRTWLTTKVPLTDEKNEIIGTIYQCQPLQHPFLLNITQTLIDQDQYYFNSNQKTYWIGEKLNNFNLSLRQQECLFYLLRGKSAEMIAKILKLSKRTIESYIEEIKNKMSCNNKKELIEKSINNGLLYFIPTTLINENISLILL